MLHTVKNGVDLVQKLILDDEERVVSLYYDAVVAPRLAFRIYDVRMLASPTYSPVVTSSSDDSSHDDDSDDDDVVEIPVPDVAVIAPIDNIAHVENDASDSDATPALVIDELDAGIVDIILELSDDSLPAPDVRAAHVSPEQSNIDAITNMMKDMPPPSDVVVIDDDDITDPVVPVVPVDDIYMPDDMSSNVVEILEDLHLGNIFATEIENAVPNVEAEQSVTAPANVDATSASDAFILTPDRQTSAPTNIEIPLNASASNSAVDSEYDSDSSSATSDINDYLNSGALNVEAKDYKHAMYLAARNITVSIDNKKSNSASPCNDDQQPSCSHWSSSNCSNAEPATVAKTNAFADHRSKPATAAKSNAFANRRPEFATAAKTNAFANRTNTFVNRRHGPYFNRRSQSNVNDKLKLRPNCKPKPFFNHPPIDGRAHNAIPMHRTKRDKFPVNRVDDRNHKLSLKRQFSKCRTEYLRCKNERYVAGKACSLMALARKLGMKNFSLPDRAGRL